MAVPPACALPRASTKMNLDGHQTVPTAAECFQSRLVLRAERFYGQRNRGRSPCTPCWRSLLTALRALDASLQNLVSRTEHTLARSLRYLGACEPILDIPATK